MFKRGVEWKKQVSEIEMTNVKNLKRIRWEVESVENTHFFHGIIKSKLRAGSMVVSMSRSMVYGYLNQML